MRNTLRLVATLGETHYVYMCLIKYSYTSSLCAFPLKRHHTHPSLFTPHSLFMPRNVKASIINCLPYAQTSNYSINWFRTRFNATHTSQPAERDPQINLCRVVDVCRDAALFMDGAAGATVSSPPDVYTIIYSKKVCLSNAHTDTPPFTPRSRRPPEPIAMHRAINRRTSTLHDSNTTCTYSA